MARWVSPPKHILIPLRLIQLGLAAYPFCLFTFYSILAKTHSPTLKGYFFEITAKNISTPHPENRISLWMAVIISILATPFFALVTLNDHYGWVKLPKRGVLIACIVDIVFFLVFAVLGIIEFAGVMAISCDVLIVKGTGQNPDSVITFNAQESQRCRVWRAIPGTVVVLAFVFLTVSLVTFKVYRDVYGDSDIYTNTASLEMHNSGSAGHDHQHHHTGDHHHDARKSKTFGVVTVVEDEEKAVGGNRGK